MIRFILAMLFIVSMSAEDISEADKALLDKVTSSHLAAASKAYDAYQSALNEAAVKTVKDLEKVKTDAMKKGNLALANAVDATEKQVKAGSLGDAVVAGANVDLLGNVEGPKQKIVGKWDVSYSNGQHDVIQVDDKLHVHVIVSTWSKVDFNLEFNDNKFTVTRVGNLQTYSFDGENLVMTHGTDVTATLTKTK